MSAKIGLRYEGRDGFKCWRAVDLAAAAEVTEATAMRWLLGEEVRGNRINAVLTRLCPRDPTTLRPLTGETQNETK